MMKTFDEIYQELKTEDMQEKINYMNVLKRKARIRKE